MRLLILSLIVLLPTLANAANLSSSREVDAPATGIIYLFVFGVAGSPAPLNITEPSCWKMKRNEKILVTTDPTWGCFNDIASAQIAAQADANKFESNFAKHGYGGGQ